MEDKVIVEVYWNLILNKDWFSANVDKTVIGKTLKELKKEHESYMGNWFFDDLGEDETIIPFTEELIEAFENYLEEDAEREETSRIKILYKGEIYELEGYYTDGLYSINIWNKEELKNYFQEKIDFYQNQLNKLK